MEYNFQNETILSTEHAMSKRLMESVSTRGARAATRTSATGKSSVRSAVATESPQSGEKASSSAVVRAINLITMFASTSEEASLSEVSERQGLSRSVTHKLLQVLLDQGLVQYDAARKTYRVGVGLYKLATAVLHETSFVQMAREMMRELVNRTGESACLNLLDSARGAFTVAAVEESAEPLQYVIEVGRWHPLHAGASGKAILAFQPDAVLDRALDHKLSAITPMTPTDALQVRRQLTEIRKNGYCLSEGERLEGAVGVAAPILDSTGVAIGSVQLTIAAHRFKRSKLADLRQAVMDAAHSISAAAQALPAANLS
jgi:DNA-binding IclR family transcriptional regulator